MRHVVWGRWRYSGMPDLGDYVQVEGVNKHTLEEFMQEGFVVMIDGSHVYVAGSEDRDDLEATRWRLGAMPADPLVTERAAHA